MVEPVGLEPTLPPCKGGVLPLNYGPVKNQEPPARCRRPPGRGTSESLPEILRPPAQCRRPRPRWQPFCLASAQTKPSRPQSRQRPVVISKMENTTSCGRCRSGGGSFSLHPRRPSLRGGVKSEIILIFVSRRPSTRFRRVCSGLRQRLGSYLAPLPVRPSSRLFSKSRGSRWAFPLSLKT